MLVWMRMMQDLVLTADDPGMTSALVGDYRRLTGVSPSLAGQILDSPLDSHALVLWCRERVASGALWGHSYGYSGFADFARCLESVRRNRSPRGDRAKRGRR